MPDLADRAGIVVALFGATGRAGTGALLACLQDARVAQVRAFVRRPLEVQHDKLRVVICSDFADLAPVADELGGVDVCLFCLGTSVRNVKDEAEYRRIHEEYALAAAGTLRARSPQASFVYLSGGGADRNSRMMWARVKAEAEDKLAAAGLASLVSARPGGIVPVEPAGLDRWLVAPMVRMFPSFGIGAVELGRALLQAGLDRAPRAAAGPLENRDLKALAARSTTHGERR